MALPSTYCSRCNISASALCPFCFNKPIALLSIGLAPTIVETAAVIQFDAVAPAVKGKLAWATLCATCESWFGRSDPWHLKRLDYVDAYSLCNNNNNQWVSKPSTKTQKLTLHMLHLTFIMSSFQLFVMFFRANMNYSSGLSWPFEVMFANRATKTHLQFMSFVQINCIYCLFIVSRDKPGNDPWLTFTWHQHHFCFAPFNPWHWNLHK